MIIAALYPAPFDPHDRHDINFSLITPGRIYAYEEAKLSIIKNDSVSKFPERSMLTGFKELGIMPSDVELWVLPTVDTPVNCDAEFLFFSTMFKIYEGSREDFDSWASTHVQRLPHHMAHIAIAVYSSEFDDCAFLSMDGGGDSGDLRNTVYGRFANSHFRIMGSDEGLNTICSFHAFITDAIGIGSGDQGKTTGLAAYGQIIPALYAELDALLTTRGDIPHVNFHRERYNRSQPNLQKVRVHEYFRSKIIDTVPSNTNVLKISLPYLPMDIARTGEQIVKDRVLRLVEQMRNKTGSENLVLSGGLFQNVGVNLAIKESGLFKNVHVSMNPSDAGLSLGAALYFAHKAGIVTRKSKLSPYLGPSFKETDVRELLDKFGLVYSVSNSIERDVARLIADGMIVGQFYGPAEFGPRALGNRSILADPRTLRSKSRINQTLKRRDWYMPYAPAILEEDAPDWLEGYQFSPYMQFAFRATPLAISRIPGAVHIDGTTRAQAVKAEMNPRLWRIIHYFKDLTGIPAVLNTSFNRHGIPTIATPRQAIEHLLEGCMDYLAIDNYIVALKDNRIMNKLAMCEEPEAQLLLKGCVERLFMLCDAKAYQEAQIYVGHLRRLVKKELRFADGDCVLDQKSYDLTSEEGRKAFTTVLTSIDIAILSA